MATGGDNRSGPQDARRRVNMDDNITIDDLDDLNRRTSTPIGEEEVPERSGTRNTAMNQDVLDYLRKLEDRLELNKRRDEELSRMEKEERSAYFGGGRNQSSVANQSMFGDGKTELVTADEYDDTIKRANGLGNVSQNQLNRSVALASATGITYTQDGGMKDPIIATMKGTAAALEGVRALGQEVGRPVTSESTEMLREAYFTNEGIKESDEAFERGLERREQKMLARAVGIGGNPFQLYVPPPKLGNTSLNKRQWDTWKIFCPSGKSKTIRSFRRFLIQVKAIIEKNELDEMSAFHLLRDAFGSDEMLERTINKHTNTQRPFHELWKELQSLDYTMDETKKADKAIDYLLSGPPTNILLWMSRLEDLVTLYYGTIENTERMTHEAGEKLSKSIKEMANKFWPGAAHQLHNIDNNQRLLYQAEVERCRYRGISETTIPLNKRPGYALCQYIRDNGHSESLQYRGRTLNGQEDKAIHKGKRVRMYVDSISPGQMAYQEYYGDSEQPCFPQIGYGMVNQPSRVYVDAIKPYKPKEFEEDEEYVFDDDEQAAFDYVESTGYGDDVWDNRFGPIAKGKNQKRLGRDKKRMVQGQNTIRRRFANQAQVAAIQGEQSQGGAVFQVAVSQDRSGYLNRQQNRTPNHQANYNQPPPVRQNIGPRQPVGNGGQAGQRFNADEQGTRRKGACFLCGMTNHWMNNCLVYPGDSIGPDRCNNCGGRHTSPCKTKSGNNRTANQARGSAQNGAQGRMNPPGQNGFRQQPRPQQNGRN